MDGFYKIPSAFKILLIELIATFFFPITVAGIITEIEPNIFPAYNAFVGFGDWLMALVGPLFVAWVLYDIFRPRIKNEVWGIFFRVRFQFCSTHPSYVLIDLLTISFAAFFLWIGITGGFETPVFWLVLATAVSFPIVRIAAWYLFGLKIVNAETYDAYKPALWAFGIFSIIFGSTALGAALI
ncbi:MAG: hypothetical protein ACJ72Z_12675 [Pyrinomonadaceae bacterium]